MATNTNLQRSAAHWLAHRGRRFAARVFIGPVQAFVSTEASSGAVLLAATVAALAWANSPWKGSYHDLWGVKVGFETSLVSLQMDLVHFVNDGLMAIFFFLVGLEIKRELLHGELASPRRAALPIAAALGGMVVPALIYLAWNDAGAGAHGWGVPMATDVAFALGALALLGRRAPFALKVFMLALAIVDDLGAIAVIVVFYSGGLAWGAIAWAVGLVLVIAFVAYAGARQMAVYVVLGALLWLALAKSGIHATVAGIILAALTPSRPYYQRQDFEASAADLVARFEAALAAGKDDEAEDALRQVEELGRDTIAPLDRLERALHPWTSYLVVPVFALANAGVTLTPDALQSAGHSAVTVGIALGLVAGKPLGIIAFTWLALRLRLGALPEGVRFLHIIGGGMLAGIGFTVSLFITALAFDRPELANEARIGILAGSAVAGLAGFVYLWIAPGQDAVEAARVAASSQSEGATPAPAGGSHDRRM